MKMETKIFMTVSDVKKAFAYSAGVDEAEIKEIKNQKDGGKILIIEKETSN